MFFPNSKSPQTAVYPVHARETSGLLKRCEPVLSPAQLKSRFLLGIPLVFPNGDVLTDEVLKDRIHLAMNEVEILLNVPITREAFQDKLPFDSSLYKAYINLVAEKGPIISIEHLAIVSADFNNIFEIPPTWIETSNFSKRLINVIPLLAAYGVNTVQGAVGNAGIAFLTVMSGLNWVPAYWQINYTAGLSNKEGQVPVPVNELIGAVAALNVLSLIAPSNIYNSQSLSQDGISQSSSGLGPRLYELRIEELERKKAELVKKLKALFFSRIIFGNI